MKSISCKEAVHLILKKEEGKLSLFARISLWRHFAICSLCKTFDLQDKMINMGLKERAKETAQLSSEEKEKIIQNVLEGK